MKKFFKHLILGATLSIALTSCGNSQGGKDVKYTKADLGDFGYVTRNLGPNAHENKTNIYELACNCIAYDLNEMGVDVLRGCAAVGDIMVPGYIFTNNIIVSYDASTDYTVCEAGFVQIHDASSTDDFLLTKSIIENSETPIVVIPDGTGEDRTVYDISLDAKIDSYSGIFRDTYFKYIQTDLHVVTITVFDNKIENYDENVDLYSFDEKRYIFKANPTQEKVLEAINMFEPDMVSLTVACKAVSDIINLQNENGTFSEISTVFMFDYDLVEEFLKTQSLGKLKDLEAETFQKLNLKENEFVMVDEEGKLKIDVAVDREEIIRERKIAGLTQILKSALDIGVTLVMCIVAPGPSASLLIRAISIVSSVATTLVSLDKLTQGVTELVYAFEGDYKNEAKSGMRHLLDAIFGEEKGASIFGSLYIGCAILGKIGSVAKLDLGKFFSKGIIKATGHILRVVAFKAVESLIIAGAVSLTTVLVTTAVYDITGNKVAAIVVGSFSGAVAGYCARFGVERLDKKFDFSGLHSKQDVKKEVKDEEFKFDKTPKDKIAVTSPSKWEEATDTQKEYTIQKMVDRVSAELDLKESPKVIFDDSMTGTKIAAFDKSTNSIIVNPNNWGDIKAVDEQITQGVLGYYLNGAFDTFTVNQQAEVINYSKTGSTTGTGSSIGTGSSGGDDPMGDGPISTPSTSIGNKIDDTNDKSSQLVEEEELIM